jgi:Uma2 family endonuclease
MHMPLLKRRWTVDDLADLPDDGQRYEVIDGELFVTPAPSPRHQDAIAELYVLLREYLSRERVGHAYFAPADVTFSRTRAVQPDLLVVPLIGGRRPDRFGDLGPLLLAVEVLSPSTARADRVAKRTMFRDEGVAEYWIVDLDARTIERSTPADPRFER